MYCFKSFSVSIVLFGIVFFNSCNFSQSRDSRLFCAEDIVENEPRKALLVLDSIKQSELTNKDTYMRYTLAKVQAKYKCYEDIKKDSLVLNVGSYFEKKKDFKRAALAYFYSGAYYLENKQNDNALLSFLMANINAQKVKDNRLKGIITHNIGERYYFGGVLDTAFIYLQQAYNYFGNDVKNFYYKQHSSNFIGLIYHKRNNLDSAYYYYDKVLELAKRNNDNKGEYCNYQYYGFHNLGVLAKDNEQYNEAKQYYYKSLPYASNTGDSLKTCIALAYVFNITKEKDSMNYYVSQVEGKLNLVKSDNMLWNLYDMLVYSYTQSGDYKDVAKYERLRGEINEKILLSKSASKLIQAKSKFQLSLEKRQLENEQFIFYLLLFIGIVVFAILFLACYFKQKTKIQKEKNRLLEERNLVLEKEKYVLTESQKLLDEKFESFVFLYILYRNITDEWIDVEREIDTLVQIYECEGKPQFFLRFEHLINSLKETSEIQIIEWAKDYLTRQNIDIDVVNKLKIDDLLLLCLNCCKAKDNEIASILGIPLRNVPRKKTYLERRLSKINSRNI